MFDPGSLLSVDPVLLMQGIVAFCAFILLFLLLYTLRDILLRTHSFAYQAACVLLVGALPIAGFLVYLLVRPARTLKEREMESMLRMLLGEDDDTDAGPEEDGELEEPAAEPPSPVL